MSVIIPPTTYPLNTTNVNPALVFSKWRLALSKVRSGSANARILFVGDSTFAGSQSSTTATIPALKSPATRLAAILNSSVTPAVISLAVPQSALSGGPDNRWTVGTGWTNGTFGAANGASYNGGTSTTGTVVYTPSPQINCDGFYVYYLGNGTLGTLTCTATGGSATPINCSLTAGVYRTLVTAGSAGTSNTLTIAAGIGNVDVVGVEPVLSTVKQLYVGNAGVGSSLSSSWAGGSATFGGIPFIKTVAPDLTIISLGINDGAALVSPATFQTNMQTIITAAQVSGDVLLTDFPQTYLPSTTQAKYNVEQSYLPIYAQLAAANNCAYLSFNARLGGVGFNTGLMASDGVHPYDTGYFDWAQFIANVAGSP